MNTKFKVGDKLRIIGTGFMFCVEEIRINITERFTEIRYLDYARLSFRECGESELENV